MSKLSKSMHVPGDTPERRAELAIEAKKAWDRLSPKSRAKLEKYAHFSAFSLGYQYGCLKTAAIKIISNQ